VAQLDGYAALIDAAERPWPQRIEAVNAVNRWPMSLPFMTGATGGRMLVEFTKITVDQVPRIRCARRLASTMPLDLIDPLTGKRLEMLNCHL